MSGTGTSGQSSAGDDVPITSGTVIKWGGFMIAIMGALVTLVAYGANLRANVESNRERTVEVDKQSAARHAQQQTEIDDLKRRQSDSERTVSELSRKLDVAVAILERIEKKIGN